MTDLEAQEQSSWTALEVLRSASASELQRQQAFERLLALNRGWWGNQPLMLFASAYALATARVLTRQRGIPVDSVDWESVATESVVVLYNGARRISESPASWLRGVIRNHVLDEIRNYYADVPAMRLSRGETEDLSDSVPASEPSSEPYDTDASDRLIAAIQRLPPSLRNVAHLLLIDRCSRKDIATLLDIRQDTLRQRIKRLTERLTLELQAISISRLESMAPPRDDGERASFINLQEAVRQMALHGQHAKSSRVDAKWNEWLKFQRPFTAGVAHRREAVRTVIDWIRALRDDV
jgi:RNA polymerase sigma factor (sigma-70 family)